MIEVAAEPAKDRIVVTVAGWLSVAEVEAFDRDKCATVAAMGLASDRYDVLVLTIGNIVQPQDVMDAFARVMQHSPERARRIATVRDGVLTRMQSRRLAKLRPGSEVFESREAAEAWLDAAA